MSGMINWAKKEIEIACKKERENAQKDEWSYGVACYKSALKAFKCLCEDGHSGMSISFTKNILNRLIDGKALTPIEDIDDSWNLIREYNKEGYETYQSNRMCSLFKDVYTDGHISYRDIDRICCVYLDNENNTYHSGFVNRIIDSMFPIKMPYLPSSKPYKVYCRDFLTDKNNGDFDTIGIYYVITPDNDKIIINRFFKYDNEIDNNFVEIEAELYKQRLANRIIK